MDATHPATPRPTPWQRFKGLIRWLVENQLPADPSFIRWSI
jgi:hypothetical protein